MNDNFIIFEKKKKKKKKKNLLCLECSIMPVKKFSVHLKYFDQVLPLIKFFKMNFIDIWSFEKEKKTFLLKSA